MTDIRPEDTARYGGKGSNLLLLEQAGYPVPRFLIIPAGTFDPGAPIPDAAIAAWIPRIQEQFPQTALFAVRSSATVEDSQQFSFAGQFKSVLQVPPESLVAAIREVLESVKEERVQSYLGFAGIRNVDMAVVIQEMVPATVSGVGFGIHPVSGARGGQVIDIVAGTGDALVDGSSNADSYTIKEGRIVHTVQAAAALLPESRLLEISALLSRLEESFGGPQDIEFSFAGDRLYLLQSRPVTTAGAGGQKIIWDNSNIIESYPGLTLPLTFSFIERMYAAVYRQLSAVLGISGRKIERYAAAYDAMLGLLNGRVYYNLNSWYRILSLLPGYKLNAGFMEKMMGVKEKPDIDLTDGVATKASFRDYLDIARAMAHILYNSATVKKQKTRFVRDFNQVYLQFRDKDYSKADYKDIWKDYQSFEQLMSARWKAPLVNDFFAMIFFGLLQKMCAGVAEQYPNIHNELVAASRDIVTTEPLRLLPQLAKELSGTPELERLLQSENPGLIWHRLQQPEYSSQLAALRRYLDTWGDRCVAELKLETITYVQEPERLIALLQRYLAEGVGYTEPPAPGRNEAEALVLASFKGNVLKKRIFRYVLGKARYLVSNRENLRYYRTKGFAVVRSMMLAFGNALAREGCLEKARDVFYLDLSDLGSIASGQLPGSAARDIVAGAKKKYALFAHLPLPERVVTEGPVPALLSTRPDPLDRQRRHILQGIPCSAGIVHARVCKVTDVQDAFPVQQVMATYATDPGYVVLFPAVSGILTERGSLLSHAAIVSREMGIPCIVGVAGLMSQLEDGDEIVMDGSTGIINIINRRET